MASRNPNFIRAQGEAFRLNKRFAGRKPGALDLEDVAMALGVLVIQGGVSGASARLVRNKHEGRIRLNERITQEGARRFAIGHELGHWLLHESESQLFLCTSVDLRDYSGSPIEAEANYFSSELLIPTDLLRPLMVKVEPDLNKIGEWAELFRASLTAMTLRFIRDSSFDCIAASIKDGKIEWWWRKEDGRRVWLEKGQMIRSGSLAWEIQQGRSVGRNRERVEPSAWFSHLPFEFSGELEEQSLSMPRYNAIFTLLWIA